MVAVACCLGSLTHSRTNTGTCPGHYDHARRLIDQMSADTLVTSAERPSSKGAMVVSSMSISFDSVANQVGSCRTSKMVVADEEFVRRYGSAAVRKTPRK